MLRINEASFHDSLLDPFKMATNIKDFLTIEKTKPLVSNVKSVQGSGVWHDCRIDSVK